MATLSGKLARIILPIDYFGKHLNLQGNITDPKLATQNFQHAKKTLCDIWSYDLILGNMLMLNTLTQLTILLRICSLRVQKKRKMKN